MSSIFRVSGVQEWHDEGYCGKGVKVMIAESNINSYHAQSVKDIIMTYAPEAIIIMYDYDKYEESDMVAHALVNGVDIINTSYGIDYPDNTFIETKALTAYRSALDAGIIIVNSSGNGGLGSIKDNGLLDKRIINVGMVDEYLEIPVESSYGNGEVDCCGMVGHMLSDNTILWGTSEAAPYVSGLLACLLSWDRRMNTKVPKFIMDNSIPLNNRNAGGAGLFRLPSFRNKLAVAMTTNDGTTKYVHKDFVYEKVRTKAYQI